MDNAVPGLGARYSYETNRVCDAIIARYENNSNHEPLVIIGHSYGADDALKMAKKLQQHNITIDLVITLDPVTPPKVPANIRLCYNIYQPSALDMLPFFRGQFDDFAKLVVPILQERGLFRADYVGSTLRDHLGLKRAPRRAP